VLLAAGTDVHARDDLALRWASQNGHVEMVKVLLVAGADVHARDDYALQWASGNDHVEMVKVLKDHIKKKKINEAIKHLSPKSDDELQQYYEKLSSEDKVREGCNYRKINLIIQGIKEKADILKCIQYLNDVYRKSPHDTFEQRVAGIYKSLKTKKSEIREALKGRNSLSKLQFAERYYIGWLQDEIYDKEGHLVDQEYLAQEFGSEYKEHFPAYIIEKIKRVFDPLREAAFKVNYKINSETNYEITLSQNIYLSDEVEDLPNIEDEEPVVLTINIVLFHTSARSVRSGFNKADYTFDAKYKDSAEIGHDEGTFTVNRKEMGDRLDYQLDYLLGDVVETEYEKFKKDILIIVEKMHTESEEYDDEKFYPQLYTESIKHLSPRLSDEIDEYNQNTLKQAREYIIETRKFNDISYLENDRFNFDLLNKNAKFYVWKEKDDKLKISVTQTYYPLSKKWKWRYFNSFSDIDDFIHQIEHAQTLL